MGCNNSNGLYKVLQLSRGLLEEVDFIDNILISNNYFYIIYKII